MASSGSASGITSETRDKNGLCLLSLGEYARSDIVEHYAFDLSRDRWRRCKRTINPLDLETSYATGQYATST